MLGELARYNQALHAENPGDAPERLNAVLRQAQQLARRDHLVILLSDFYGHDIQTRDLLLGLRPKDFDVGSAGVCYLEGDQE